MKELVVINTVLVPKNTQFLDKFILKVFINSLFIGLCNLHINSIEKKSNDFVIRNYRSWCLQN